MGVVEKVVFSIEIEGACGTIEIAKMTTEDVDVLSTNGLFYSIPDSKTHNMKNIRKKLS